MSPGQFVSKKPRPHGNAAFFSGRFAATLDVSQAGPENPGVSKVFFRRRRLLADRAKLGRWGEKRAERLLKRKGLQTLVCNFSCKTGELDRIMVDRDGTIVFVEVKTRADEEFAPAEAAVTSAKRRRMTRAAHYFLACHDLQDRPCRFDVVTIILGQSGRPQIRHYENAFVP